MAAGIRPNVELGRTAGLHVNRGIVVNDYMETSHPDIFAVGECVEHNGICYGLVAPLIEQGKVLAATITGNKGPVYQRHRPGGEAQDHGRRRVLRRRLEPSADAEAVRYEDPSLGIYKKLVLRDGRLAGVILVGDTSDSHRYMDWLRADTDLTSAAPTSAVPAASLRRRPRHRRDGRHRHDLRLCRRHQGRHHPGDPRAGVNTLSQLKEATRASTGCGSCTSLARTCSKRSRRSSRKKRRRFSARACRSRRSNLREILRTQRLKSVQDVLDIYGNGPGCEVCKPALSYMLDMLWCGDHDEDRSARFINDRVHANIQKDGTFSVVPRMRGGVTTPDELRRIADVADKYNVPMVKITGSQRIDLLGVRKEDLPEVWADLGMPSGQAYTKGVRMVKTCVGTEFCRFGTQDSTSAGIELERRLENLFTPHKVKMASVGCPRNCAEATVKDIGLVGQEGSWQVVVGGAAGKCVRKADLLITVETTEEALEAAELFFQYYREHGNYLERTYDFVERARHRQGAQGDGLRARRTCGRGCSIGSGSRKPSRAMRGWKAQTPVHPTQFIPIQPIDRVSHERRQWVRITACENIPPREGRAAMAGDREIALFNLGDRFLAVDNRCPHQGGPLADGIVAGRRSSARCTPGRSISRPDASSVPPGQPRVLRPIPPGSRRVS